MRFNLPGAVGIGSCLIATVALLLCDVETGAQPPAPSPAIRTPSAVTDNLPIPPHPSLVVNRYMGVGSCAATGCHGGDSSRGTVGSEYSIWIQQDPHSRAYSVLHNALSQQIVRKLKLKVPAHEATECLNCHAVSATSDNLASNHRFTIADGVSCESCHGPAEQWLEPHKQRQWETLSTTRKSAQGFWDLDDILTRARVCGSCHVGSPGRDVNHDLIAAGHPPLKFELSNYHARMPRHWNEKKDRKPHLPAFEAKLWAVGQVASAEMSVRQLEYRARKNKIWPEFAEYGCFACHHDLRSASWRQKRGYGGRLAGELVWGTWSTPLLPTLANASGTMDGDKLSNSLHKLSDPLASPYRSKPRDIANQAAATAALFSQWAETLNARSFSRSELHRLQTDLAGEGQNLSALNWDAAVQVYLAMVAMERSRIQQPEGERPSPNHAEVYDRLDSIRRSLTFPTPTDGVHYNSPENFGPDRVKVVQEALDRIQELIGTGN